MTRLLLAVAVLTIHAGLSLADDGGLSSTKLGKLGLGDLQIKEGATLEQPEVDIEPVDADVTVEEISPNTTPTPTATLRRLIEPVLSRPAKPQAVVESLPMLSINKENISGGSVTGEKIAVGQPDLELFDADDLIDVNAEVARRRRELEQAQDAAKQTAAIAAGAVARIESLESELVRIQADIASMEATLGEKTFAARLAAARVALAQSALEKARAKQAAAE